MPDETIKMPSFQTPSSHIATASPEASLTSTSATASTVFRPTLAQDAKWTEIAAIIERGDLLYASPKIDGIRCVIRGGQAISRTLKPIRNQHVQKYLQSRCPEGFDGELVVGDAFGEGVFARTSSGIMSGGGAPDFTYWVFDSFTYQGPYSERLLELKDRFYLRDETRIRLLPQVLVTSLTSLQALEEEYVTQGYEGAILRWAHAPYKLGRSTLRERFMLKLKRFLDSEAEIIGFEELKHNANEATIDARGFTARSSSKIGKIGSNTLGAVQVRDLKNPSWVFSIGSGFDFSTRDHIWGHQEDYLGKIIKYRYLPIGVKDLPRHPTCTGFRHLEDM